MVNKFLGLFKKEYKGINEAAFLLGLFAFFSQILGLVRDRSLAHFIGASSSLDAYYTAFRIPDFLYVSVASLASITVLIPFLVRKLEKGNGEGKAEAQKFVSDVFTVFFFAMIVISGIIFIFMPYIASLIAPGFKGAQLHEVVVMSRVMLLSPILLGLSNLFGSITQIYKKFFVFALSPVFYNIGIIFGIWFLRSQFGIYGLAMGVVLGAVLHFAIQLPVLFEEGFLPRISFNIDWKEIKKVVFLSLPRTIGVSLNNVALLYLVALATKLESGSVSIFNFSLNLQSVPLAIVGMSFAVAAFPALVEAFTLGKNDVFISKIIGAMRQIIFWSLPVVFLFIVLRAQIVRVILGSGAFSWDNTRLTAAALALFAISVVAQSAIMLFVRGYYAAGQTARPLRVNFYFSLGIIVLAHVLLYVFGHMPVFKYFIESMLRVDGVPGTSVLMLPLAYSLGTIGNAFAHWILFRKDFIKDSKPLLQKSFFQSFAGAFTMGAVAYECLNILDNVFDINTFRGILFQGLISGIVGIISGIVMLKLLKNPDIEDAIRAVKNKFWKTEVIAPAQEELL